MVNKDKFKEEEARGYRVDIVGRGIEVTEPIRAYVGDKLSKIEHLHTHILHLHVTLEIHKLEHSCTILLKIDHTQVKSHAGSSDMYASIDRAIDKLRVLIARYKSRIQDHHKKKLSVIDMQVNVLRRPYNEIDEINTELEMAERALSKEVFAPPHIIGTETKPLKTLTLDEALMRIDLSGDHFLIFRSEEDRRLKVIYRRSDGHYGVVQPE